tara:strand:+ start:118 stop:231 length:114 start_codon:yes stop_codon:yes gene_type:complete
MNLTFIIIAISIVLYFISVVFGFITRAENIKAQDLDE